MSDERPEFYAQQRDEVEESGAPEQQDGQANPEFENSQIEEPQDHDSLEPDVIFNVDSPRDQDSARYDSNKATLIPEPDVKTSIATEGRASGLMVPGQSQQKKRAKTQIIPDEDENSEINLLKLSESQDNEYASMPASSNGNPSKVMPEPTTQDDTNIKKQGTTWSQMQRMATFVATKRQRQDRIMQGVANGLNQEMQAREDSLQSSLSDSDEIKDDKYAKGKNTKIIGLDAAQLKSRLSLRASTVLLKDEDEDVASSHGQTQYDDMGFTDCAHSVDEDADLRRNFVENYGVSISFPCYYSDNGCIVPHKAGFIVSSGFHVIPRQSAQRVQVNPYVELHPDLKGSEDYEPEATHFQQSYEEMYDQTGSSLILKLQQTSSRSGFKTHKQVQLGGIRQAMYRFSPSGKWFAIFLQQSKHLVIFDATNVIQLFEDIEHQRSKMFKDIGKHIDKDRFGFAVHLEFDDDERYVAVGSQRHVLVYSLDRQNHWGKSYKRSINQDKYSQIMDLHLSSDETTFQLVAACLVEGITNIDIFELGNSGKHFTIAYTQQPAKMAHLKVMISDDGKSALFSNGFEHYIHDGGSQANFPWIKDKFIRYAASDGSKGFYIATSKDYDRDIDILHSKRNEFHASVKKFLEPGLFQVYDMSVVTFQEGEKKGKKGLNILCKVGDYLNLEIIDLELAETDEDEAVMSSHMYRFYNAYSFNWPYFGYATRHSDIFIMNAFNPEFVQCYGMPERVHYIAESFLTDTHDFFALAVTLTDKFEIFHLDLDSPNPRMRSIYAYPFDVVNAGKVQAFHCRGSSRKEKINLNEMLVCYMMHDDRLYYWVEGNQHVIKLDENASNLYYMSDNTVFYLHSKLHKVKGKEKIVSHVKQVDTLFGGCTSREIYKDYDLGADFLNFGVDNTKKRLIVLTGVKNLKGKRDKFLTIFCLQKEQIIYKIQLENKELIGRLKSNLYNFAEGHIYFGNSLFKIRYDLIQLNERDGRPIKEQQLFDTYHDILPLEPTQEVQSGTPMQTCLYNRLAYIIRNQKELQARKLLIMPYLHERRIYLNRRHHENQFYTIRRYNGQTYIQCMCFNKTKMYIYTETGKLIDRYVYEREAATWGKPQAMSEDGKYILFRRSEKAFDYDLIEVGIKHFRPVISQLNISHLLANFIKTSRNIQQRNQTQQFWKIFLQELKDPDDILVSAQLNDHGDMIFRIKPHKSYMKRNKAHFDAAALQFFEESDKSESGEDQEKEHMSHCSLFFFVPGRGSKNQSFVYFDSPTDKITNLRGISMNADWLFLWNDGFVWKFHLLTHERTKMDLYISLNEKQTKIKRVRTGSNSNFVCIRVSQTPTQDCIIQWDLKKDLEVLSVDIAHDALFFQDEEGNAYLAEKDVLVILKTGARVKCYGLNVSEFSVPKFDFGQGNRVECVTDNWLIFRNYINLSFSYMTFVIKDNFDEEGYVRDDFLFDIEGYDYIYNRQSIFTSDKNLITLNYDKLNFILNNYQEKDPMLLEILHYVNKDGKIPLQIALESKNHRMVNLLLSYMADINFAAVSQLQSSFDDLLVYHGFEKYLCECPFDTVQMVNKQTLKIRTAEDKTIVATAPHTCSYVDGDYFRDVMGEKTDQADYLTFPVTVKAVRADWLLDETTSTGLDFLRDLMKVQDKTIFETDYVAIVIQFLYSRFREKIISNKLPMFVIHLISVLLAVIFNDIARTKLYNETIFEDEHETNAAEWLAPFFNFIALIVNCLNLYDFVLMTSYLIKTEMPVLTRFWSYIDALSLLLNFIASIGAQTGMQVQLVRRVEAFLIIVMFLKLLYYLRLIPQIAPLISIMLQIVEDIKWFFLIFVIFIVALTLAFHQIGRNQIEMHPEYKEDGGIPYSTYLGAFDHVYTSSLGELGTDTYYGDGEQTTIIILFLFMSFFMTIHLLNMLIAMMGESFAKNAEDGEAKKKMSQLEFVVNNWYIDPIENKERIVYIIAAKSNAEVDNTDEKFVNLEKRMDRVQIQQENMIAEIKNIMHKLTVMTSTHLH